ncbi:MAG: tetratricopeptide repeat protein [Chitinophagaceae bacterium]
MFLLLLYYPTWAQPGTVVNLNKPAKYENRVLPSEKSTDKPLNPLKKVTQNLGSHYNYHFNGTQKLNEILFNARTAQKDDFSKLLSFYPISLDATASQNDQIDSILIKCNDAILLHDLRSDWVDDFYLLMGKAFFYRKDFDSALVVFQYLNYAFQPRKKEEIGFIKYIGSNLEEGGNSFTISTKERANILKRFISNPPARNEAFLWTIRSLIEKEQHQDAWSLIETLKRDKNFPARLAPKLKELQALLYYNEKQFDSAAFYLESCLNTFPQSDKSRQEYLLAQLYEKSQYSLKADYYYEKAIGHTTDLIMEAFARINRIKLIKDKSSNEQISEQISELMKMIKKEKYADYQHFIYYAAAQMENTRDSVSRALNFLRKSTQYSTNDPEFRNKAFLELGDLAWKHRQYRIAALGYDSVVVNDSSVGINAIELNERKGILSKIIPHLDNILIEDSLLRVASMSEADRNLYVRNLLRQLRKEKGLQDEPTSFGSSGSRIMDPTKEDKPADLFAENTTKGEWYFYNVSIRSKGMREFEVTWGKRPNVDNWRREKAISAGNALITKQGEAADADSTRAENTKQTPSILTLEALVANLPLTPEQKQASQDTIETSMYLLGKIYRESLNDCSAAIDINEELLKRYPKSNYLEEVVYGLYFCYTQIRNNAKAETYKNFLTTNFKKSPFTRLILDPVGVAKEIKQLDQMATLAYEQVYTSFIEGNFKKAILEKKIADSSFGENFWTPQLLYIESVYYVREKNDSLALDILKKLQMLFPTSAITPKAKILADVVGKRAELEKYLTELDVVRVNEVEQTIDPALIDSGLTIKDSVKLISSIPENIDSTKNKPNPSEHNIDGYTFNPSDIHVVVLVLQKIDNVYLNEARNALRKYNREQLIELPIINTTDYGTDIRFLSLGNFSNRTEANAYLAKVNTESSRSIFPWLPKEKYYFLAISTINFEQMVKKQELERYQQIIKEHTPYK